MDNPKFQVNDIVKLEGKITRVFTNDIAPGWVYNIIVEGEKFLSPVLPLSGIDVHERGITKLESEE